VHKQYFALHAGPTEIESSAEDFRMDTANSRRAVSAITIVSEVKVHGITFADEREFNGFVLHFRGVLQGHCNSCGIDGNIKSPDILERGVVYKVTQEQYEVLIGAYGWLLQRAHRLFFRGCTAIGKAAVAAV
jgi:hypothetical protein